MTIVLDAGALMGVEKRNRRVDLLVRRSHDRGERVVVPAGVVARVWRDGRRQARLARLLHPTRTEIVPLDDHAAREVGQLLRSSRSRDVVGASVVWCARKRDATVVTSDPDHLRRLDPRVRLEPI